MIKTIKELREAELENLRAELSDPYIDGFRRAIIAGAIKRIEAELENLPFGLEHADQLTQPFCACGHVTSACDGSRAACRRTAPLSGLAQQSGIRPTTKGNWTHEKL